MSLLHEVTVTKKTKIAENAFTIEFERKFDFNAGQIIGVTNSATLAPRLYSICSSPHEKNIKILFSVKHDGELTPALARIETNDKVWITTPQGKFTFKNEPAWWIATGTGIAPFYSMFTAGQKPLKLVHGARYHTDLYFNETLNQLHDYIKCCSQENYPGAFNGRLTNYLRQQETLPSHINYYICGSAEMVVEVRDLLIGKGVPFKNIITEIYF